MQDGAITERVDEPREAAGVAVDVGLGIIGEDRGGVRLIGLIDGTLIE